MNKEQKRLLKNVIDDLENIFQYHNKNLYKWQYYTIDEDIYQLKEILKRK